jgi:hypothetical protein
LYGSGVKLGKKYFEELEKIGFVVFGQDCWKLKKGV